MKFNRIHNNIYAYIVVWLRIMTSAHRYGKKSGGTRYSSYSFLYFKTYQKQFVAEPYHPWAPTSSFYVSYCIFHQNGITLFPDTKMTNVAANVVSHRHCVGSRIFCACDVTQTPSLVAFVFLNDIKYHDIFQMILREESSRKYMYIDKKVSHFYTISFTFYYTFPNILNTWEGNEWEGHHVHF